jgi:hypothetical protein
MAIAKMKKKLVFRTLLETDRNVLRSATAWVGGGLTGTTPGYRLVAVKKCQKHTSSAQILCNLGTTGCSTEPREA